MKITKLFFNTAKLKTFVSIPLLIMAILSLLFQSCSNDDDEQVSDTEVPSIYIMNPTSEGAYVTSEDNLTIGGTAHDNFALKTISWQSSSGQNGTAIGLEEWNISDLPLTDGDNIITITAIDASNNKTDTQIVVTRNKHLTFLGVPYTNNNIFFTNIPTEVWITTSIAPNENLIPSSVKLVEVDGNNKFVKEICSLTDEGDLENDGDEIKGDNVFSTKYTFNFKQIGETRFRISAKTTEEAGEVEAFSSVFSFNTINKENAEMQVKSLLTIHEDAEEKIAELLKSGIEQTEVTQQLITWLFDQPDVKEVSENNNLITIMHTSDLESYVLLGANDTKGRKTDDSPRSKKATLPLEKQTRGTFEKKIERQAIRSRASSTKDDNFIQNKSVFIWAPFQNKFPQAMETSLRPIFNTSPIDFTNKITYLTNNDCNRASLQNMINYGIVILDTHGADGNLILTKEKTSMLEALIDEGIIEFFSGYTSVITMSSGTYYAVTAKFIKNKINGKFANSVIFNGSCESTKTDRLSNAFISKGAKTYLGFRDNVYVSFCKNKADEFFSSLVGDELKTTGESFKADGMYEFRGSTEMHFYLGLINGDFEYGNLNGWNVSGDGRIITQLGPQYPTQPYYMGIVSTGLGYTLNYGSIHQTFKVTNETILSLKWNFLSEEFMEYVGSKYQDYLRISIKEGGTTNVLFNKAIDQFASQYSLVKVSPSIVFDQGDVYMTGWQYSTFDISSYQGKTITLSIETGDIGDSVYDSATLLDEITTH